MNDFTPSGKRKCYTTTPASQYFLIHKRDPDCPNHLQLSSAAHGKHTFSTCVKNFKVGQ